MSERNDPLQGFNFIISLMQTSSKLSSLITNVDVAISGGFSECTGLEGTLQVEEYPEGGENRYVHKFPTRMTYSNITLKRGITFSQDLWQWHSDYVKGKGKRLDGLIALLDQERNPVRHWAFRRGLPLKWIGPTFHATQNTVAIESLEIVHEGWRSLPLSISLQQVGKAFGNVGQAVKKFF
jgi:phage tail-like protein